MSPLWDRKDVGATRGAPTIGSLNSEAIVDTVALPVEAAAVSNDLTC